MKYVAKTLQNDQGYDVSCWVAMQGEFDLITGTARLKLFGWKDATAYNNDKAPSDTKWVTVSLADLSTFEAVWTEIAGRLISTGGAFEGGTIEDTETE